MDVQLEQLVAALVSRETGLVAVVPELDGLDGAGTTTLAEAACADPRVREHFTDGIAWVTVGSDPFDLVGEQLGGRAEQVGALISMDFLLTRWLVDDDDLGDLGELGAAELERLLESRRWFDLATTDEEQFLATALAHGGSALIVLDGLRDPDLALIAVMVAPAATLLVTARTATGFHPGATIVRLPGWALLPALARSLGTAEPAVPDAREPGDRTTAVHQVLDTGLARLGIPDSVERLTELGVFAGDRNIPASLARAMWRESGGLSAEEANLTLSGLEVLGLLRVAPDRDAILLPDPVRSYIARSLTADRRGHLARCLVSGLDHLDGEESAEAQFYLMRHLPEHYAQAGAPVAELVCDPRWIHLKLRSPLELERDLAKAGTAAAGQLRRTFAQCAHLLGGEHPHAVATLASRLPGLPAIARGLGEQLNEARTGWLECLWEPPDLPPSSLRRTLPGMDARVSALAAGPGWVVAGDEAGNLRSWRVDGSSRAWFAGHDDTVTCVAVSPDGGWLVTGGADRTTRIWADDGSQRAEIHHLEPVSAVAIAPDGGWVVTVADGLQAWDLGGGLLWGSEAEVRSTTTVAVCGGGAWVALTTPGAGVQVVSWGGAVRGVIAGDASAALPTRTFPSPTRTFPPPARPIPPPARTFPPPARHPLDHPTPTAPSDPPEVANPSAEGTVPSGASGPSGAFGGFGRELLVSGHADGRLRLWESDGTQAAEIAPAAPATAPMAVAPDGSWLACRTAAGGLLVQPLDGTKGTIRYGHARAVTRVAISPDGDWVASAAQDGTVKLWDREEGMSRPDEHLRRRPLSAVAVAGQGDWLVTAGADGLTRWDGGGSAPETISGTGPYSAVAISPDETWLAALTDDGTLRVLQPDGKIRAEITPHHGHPTALTIANPTQDPLESPPTEPTPWDSPTPEATPWDPASGSWIAAAGVGPKVRLWRPDGRPLPDKPHSRAKVLTHVVADPGGRWLAAADLRRVYVWNLPGADARRIPHGDTVVEALAVAPHGDWLAVASQDGTIRTFSPAGAPLATFEGVSGEVTGLAVGPFGAWLAAVTAQGLLRVWDVRTEECVAEIRVERSLRGCAWAPGGTRLYAVGDAGLYGFKLRLPR